jgi:hypothetical protein
MTQGQEANHSGQFLEGVIEAEFRKRGTLIKDWIETNGGHDDLFAPRQLVRQRPFTLPWGKTWRCDFVFTDSSGFSIAIECKSQVENGSTDMKLPTVFDHCFVGATPEHYECWLMTYGDGASIEIINWLKHRAKRLAGQKVIQILSMEEARAEIKRRLGGR